jgi:phospho-N-acetylmuramoyl-pentapeptide-transferase
MLVDATRVLVPFILSFVIGIALSPIVAHYLYQHQAWKKKAGKGNGMGDSTGTPLFDALHKEREVSTPRMGGIVVWGATFLTMLFLILISYTSSGTWSDLSFINRGQTWLPLFALLVGALVGLIDDILEVTRSTGGLRLRYRIVVVALLGGFCGWWFYAKLGVSSIGVPFVGSIPLGPLFIPFFIFVTLALYAGGIIDGIDGLAGGVFAIIFLAYSGIAFSQGQIALAGFTAALAGGLFAFLWFNIPPARFYLSETGSMALTLALAVTAFTADTLGGGVGVFVLPVIAFPLVFTVVTSMLQVFSKKVFKKKIFAIAPIHHHFETLGWPAYKVTMRYWVITIITGIFGVALALLK